MTSSVYPIDNVCIRIAFSNVASRTYQDVRRNWILVISVDTKLNHLVYIM